MRKLKYSVDLERMERIKHDIVPAIFTQHQFELIKRKFSGRKLSDSEKNEFSRTVSKKMKAINRISGKDEESVFTYGEGDIIPERLEQAKKYLNRFKRKFKDKHIMITGSFLFQKKYNDIDIFVISRYEKEDYHLDRFHINHFTEDVYTSLFFDSIRKLCVSDREIERYVLKEKADIDTFISLYQELFNDIDGNFPGVRSTLREFLLQAAHISNRPTPGPKGLKIESDKILKMSHKKEMIKNIFINAALLDDNKSQTMSAMEEMIDSYDELIKEYRQHKNYYADITDAFRRVKEIGS